MCRRADNSVVLVFRFLNAARFFTCSSQIVSLNSHSHTKPVFVMNSMCDVVNNVVNYLTHQKKQQ